MLATSPRSRAACRSVVSMRLSSPRRRWVGSTLAALTASTLAAVGRPLLVVVSGPPGAGKTSLGRQIALYLGLPFLNKDGFKEVLFETLGWSDRGWSRRLGRASMLLLFHATERLLAAGASVVIEANFDADLSCQELRTLQQRYAADACQIQCVGDGEVFVRRF